MLTTHLLIRNNQSTIRETLHSLPSEAHILVGDIGCHDATADICKSFGATVIPVSLNDDLSRARNYLLSRSQTDWNLWLEPWESLLHGSEILTGCLHGPAEAYRLNLIRGDVVTKPIRLWHKQAGLQFKNPVFETLDGASNQLPIYLSGGEEDIDFQEQLLEKWSIKAPLLGEVTYYRACLHLTKKNWRAFLNTADHYLHREKGQTMSALMTRYYCSMVSCYIEKDGQKAANYLLPCLAEKPLMAEFWCLLADIYFSGKIYDKAQCFYENAIILGSRRPADEWPVELSRYKEYPEKMIAACETARNSVKIYKGKSVPFPRSSS